MLLLIEMIDERVVWQINLIGDCFFCLIVLYFVHLCKIKRLKGDTEVGSLLQLCEVITPP